MIDHEPLCSVIVTRALCQVSLIAFYGHLLVQAALAPRCQSDQSRIAAYELLQSVVRRRDTPMKVCLRRLLAMLGPGPAVDGVLQQQHQQHNDVSASFNPHWRGLKSTGATCYMNAIIQQLFCQPTIRAMILRSPEVPEADMGEEKHAVFAAMQLMFANLALSTARHFTPQLMWESLRDEMGQPINIMVRCAVLLIQLDAAQLRCHCAIVGFMLGIACARQSISGAAAAMP